jgi:hypothetical protein
LVLLALGLLVLFLSTMLRTRVFVMLLLLSFPLYIAARTVGGWSGDQLLAVAQLSGSEDRVESLQTRLRSEYYLMERAKLQPLFGWGGWDRSLVGDENNIVKTTEGLLVQVIPDSFWIVNYGMYGVFGLASITIALLMPLLLLTRRFPPNSWATPEIAPVAVLAIILGLYMVDNLMNDMVNPLFTLAAGGVIGALRGSQKERACRIKPKADTPVRMREKMAC